MGLFQQKVQLQVPYDTCEGLHVPGIWQLSRWFTSSSPLVSVGLVVPVGPCSGALTTHLLVRPSIHPPIHPSFPPSCPPSDNFQASLSQALSWRRVLCGVSQFQATLGKGDRNLPSSTSWVSFGE